MRLTIGILHGMMIVKGLYCNWIRHNRKLYNSGEMKGERTEKFKELMELSEKYKRVNQYQ